MAQQIISSKNIHKRRLNSLLETLHPSQDDESKKFQIRRRLDTWVVEVPTPLNPNQIASLRV